MDRERHLSDEQIVELRRRMRLYVGRTVMWSVPWPVLALVPAIWLLVARGDASLFFLPIVGVMPVGVLLAYVIFRARRVIADVDSGRVLEVTGPIERIYVNTRSGQALVRIGATRMECFGTRSDPGWQQTRSFLGEARRGGKTVRVLYLPVSKLIVSAEIG